MAALSVNAVKGVLKIVCLHGLRLSKASKMQFKSIKFLSDGL